MNIILNGQPVVTTCTVLKDFLISQKIDIHTVATAVNQDFVPRSLYATTQLTDGMRLEVVSPMQGG